MKAFIRWLGKIVGSVITISLIIVFFPHISKYAAKLMPDESGTSIKASVILATKLENSARLETLKVKEEGALNYEIKAAFVGTVVTMNLNYTYEASFGIDLKKTELKVAGNKITFVLPFPELIQDSLTPIEIAADDFWYPGFSEQDYENVLERERLACREAYQEGDKLSQLYERSLLAFETTIASWMQEIDNHLEFDYQWADQTVAE